MSTPDTPVLADLLRTLERAWEAGGVAKLPAVEGLEAPTVARALYRVRLEREARWVPFVHIHGATLGADPVPVLREVATPGAWVLLAPAPTLDLCTIASDVRWIVPDADAAALVWPSAAVARLRALDAWHLPATDPALDDLRRSLLSHCRSASIVHLQGAEGAGKRDLACWAHATLDERPLSELTAERDARPVAGQWLLFPEVSELDADRLHHLRVALERGRPSMPTRPEPAEDVRRPEHSALTSILGRSPTLLRALERAARAARTNLPVLVLGETGVGKELFARALHDASGRRGSFHPIDVSTLNPQIVESELFGHASGAFTGAEKARKGAVRSAEGGTLFLDELGNVEPKIQAKLLRLLQERTVQPVGSDETVQVDVRFVAATNADLQALVRRGEFRADLLHRLEAVTLEIPPLRERGEDVQLLAEAFFEEARGKLPTGWLSDEAARLLRDHVWPGNVRELRQVMHVAAFECETLPVRPQHLGPLAPRNRRPVPVITTQSTPDGERASIPLPHSLAQRMTTVTLKVPSLVDRGPASVRHAVLAALDGHAIRADALDLLVRRPWRRNLPELVADVRALAQSTRGPIDRTTVVRHLPHLLASASVRPIVVLWSPSMEDGEVVGLERSFPSGSVLIGRVRQVAQLDQLAATVDAADRDRLHDQLAEIRRLVRDEPRCIAFPHLPFLSRAHALVTLDDQGFRLNVLPGVTLPVWAGRLGAGGGPISALGAAGTARFGDAFELQIRGEDGNPGLQLFLFAGRVAREEHGPEAVARTGEGEVRRVEETRVWTLPARPVVAGRPTSPWTLNEAELTLLNDVVERYEGGPFSAHVKTGLEIHRQEPLLARLVAFVLDVRPSQYASVLYEHPGNEPLRADLARRLKRAGRSRAWLGLLPTGIQRAVEGLL